MADITRPNFILYPVNNNRTAWKPVSFPVILIVTNRYDPVGSPIDNSEVFNVRMFIESVPHEARVSGHQHIGMRFPDKELYARSIQTIELSTYYIPKEAFTVKNSSGDIINYDDATNGDLMTYTTSTGVTSTIEFVQGAEYYDLSEAQIEIEQLPSDIYNLVYECSFYNRVISSENPEELLCIDTSFVAISQYRIQINHPGEILEEMFRRTPGVLFDTTSKASNTTIGFYRPYSDVLQDTMDEQKLLKSLNWIYDASSESIPLISDLLGWNVPYFPTSLDKLRKAVLRRTVELQHLKGSKRAITELFKLFGFQILISNLWSSSDGQVLIRPNVTPKKPYQDQKVTLEITPQIDIILNDYQTSGYGSLTIPLLHRPQQIVGIDNFSAAIENTSITIDAYLVEVGSDAYIALQNIADEIQNDPDDYGSTSGGYIEYDNYRLPKDITSIMSGLETVGHSQILLSDKYGNSIDETLIGQQPPLSKNGCIFNIADNNIAINFNGYIDLTGLAIFAFATYDRAKYIVPTELTTLRTNWFDIQLLTPDLIESADPTILEFVLEFLRYVKSFHSLLNVVVQRVELNDDYQTTDIKIGGNISQRYDVDLGKQQVPPAIIPIDPTGQCISQNPLDLGYKESDILYRNRLINSLRETLDRTKEERSNNIEYDHHNGLGPNDSQSIPIPQIIIETANSDTSTYIRLTREYENDRTQYETLDGSSDYYYVGKAKDDILHASVIKLDDIVSRTTCVIGYGNGVYWTYPTYSQLFVRGTTGHIFGSRPTQYTSHRNTTGTTVNGVQAAYITSTGNTTYSTISDMNNLYRKLNNNSEVTLHYSNKKFINEYDQNYYLALHKPSLNITKATLHLPGCRFPRYNVKTTYTHPDYLARPYDGDYCDDPTFLNYAFTLDTNGDQILTYDYQRVIYTGNNIDSDIVSYGDHTGYSGVADEVIHKIYTTQYTGHPAVEWEDDDQVTEALTSSIDVTTPMFNSYNECGSGLKDYIDGYGSVYGWQTISDMSVSNNIDRDGTNADLLDGLGCPPDPTTPIDVLFYYGSGIVVEKGFRYDCGCLLFGCDGTDYQDTICSINDNLDEDGMYDFNEDMATFDMRLVLNESYGVHDVYYDGTIPSYLETI